LIWNFFAKGHGKGHRKGKVDKVGALLKCEVSEKKKKLSGRNFQNLVEVIAFLKFKAIKYPIVYPNVRQQINKFFHEITLGDVDRTRPWACSTMKGNYSKHQVHSFSSKDPTLCQYRQLFCFCVSCMDGGLSSECVNKEQVPEWTLT
jgi:hypothetical protein